MEKRVEISLPNDIRDLILTLEQAGFSAWAVGGFVRDAVMGKPAHDVDVATSAPWQDVRDLFLAAGARVYETGTAHGTVTVGTGSNMVEVTTYRVDGPYRDSRHPSSVEFVDSIEDDLARRDFTINAMAYNPDRGILDPFGGMDDIENGVIRTVGDPRERFSEDALRIMRAVRFSSQLGFRIEDETGKALMELKDRLGNVAMERIESEFSRMLVGQNAVQSIVDWIDVIGVFVPEALPMKGFDQHTRYHVYDVLEHTAHVVGASPARRIVRYAAFFHDIGKPDVFFVDQNGVGHFYGHAPVSADITRTVLNRLRLKKTDAERICKLVAAHDDTFLASTRNVRRTLMRLDGDIELFNDLMDLKIADAAAHAPGYGERGQQAAVMKGLLTEVLEHDAAFSTRDLAIDGNDVIAAGVPAGPGVGEVLKAALDQVVEEKVPNTREALLEFLESVAGAWQW